MACKKCGSDWTTPTGQDCVSCPHCCKQQRCKARKDGRWVEPTAQKTCEECGGEFTAVGLQEIQVRVLCHNPQCKKSRRNKVVKAGNARRASGIYVLSREPKQKRCCKFSKCGKELTRREQKDYCDKTCYFAAVVAGEQQFKGRVRDAWTHLFDWAHEWDAQRPEWAQCLACGKDVEQSANGQRKFCDDNCRYRYEFPLPTECCDCHCPITSQHYRQKRCCDCKRKRLRAFKREAKRLLGNYRRRCRHYGVPYDSSVTRRKVFERDNYTCQLCGVKCLERFTLDDGVPDPVCPTVDHIIALSKRLRGHTWDNVQCACWQCNVDKGAAARGQLRLALV